MKHSFLYCALVGVAILSCQSLFAQKVRTVTWTTNTDESKVPEYTLPDVLTCIDGSKVTSVKEWEEVRRPELVEMLTTYMYGKVPEGDHLGYEVLGYEPRIMNGLATRKIVRVYLSKEGNKGPCVEAHIYSPNIAMAGGPGMGPGGPQVAPPKSPAFLMFSMQREATIQKLLRRGYGVIFFNNKEVAPDDMTAFEKGVIPYYYRPGQTFPDPDQWGSIAAWAWAASRIMDYIEVDKNIDVNRVVVHGHSRLGKTALWAGAIDKRFAMVYPAGSGCSGVAISRRMFGETLFDANTAFGHWLAGNFQQFSRRENFMPFDQHEVVALCAPRPVYIGAGEDDTWADPRGEYLSGRAASPVWELYGLKGLVSEEMPAVDTPDQEGTIAYHVHTGGHTVNDYDWEQFLKYADKYLKK